MSGFASNFISLLLKSNAVVHTVPPVVWLTVRVLPSFVLNEAKGLFSQLENLSSRLDSPETSSAVSWFPEQFSSISFVRLPSPSSVSRLFSVQSSRVRAVRLPSPSSVSRLFQEHFRMSSFVRLPNPSSVSRLLDSQYRAIRFVKPDTSSLPERLRPSKRSDLILFGLLSSHITKPAQLAGSFFFTSPLTKEGFSSRIA